MRDVSKSSTFFQKIEKMKCRPHLYFPLVRLCVKNEVFYSKLLIFYRSKKFQNLGGVGGKNDQILPDFSWKNALKIFVKHFVKHRGNWCKWKDKEHEKGAHFWVKFRPIFEKSGKLPPAGGPLNWLKQFSKNPRLLIPGPSFYPPQNRPFFWPKIPPGFSGGSPRKIP